MADGRESREYVFCHPPSAICHLHRLVLLILALLIAFSAFAADAPLTRAEQQKRFAALPDEHKQFLVDVGPIIQPAERDAFLRLETSAQRDAFIEDFWRRRDIARGTTNHAARAEYTERLDFVKQNFESVASDRGKVYLLQGPPADMVDINCTSEWQPIQIWRYDFIEGLGHDFWLLFYMPRGLRQYRLWQPIKGRLAGMAVDDLRADRAASMMPGAGGCRNSDVLERVIGAIIEDADHVQRVTEVPRVNEEDMSRLLRAAVLSDPTAPPLGCADMSVAYMRGIGLKTDTQITIYIPREQLTTTTTGGVSVYTIDVVGEVIRNGKMWEKYRYRFDFPGDVNEDRLPIVIDRMLRPATYHSRIKIADATTRAQTILEDDLIVPQIATPQNNESNTIEAIREEITSSRASLRIIPLPDGVISGVTTIGTILGGSSIKAVEFWLDGKKIATRRRPPYALDLDFGTVPRARQIRAVALDAHDAVITGDEILVNGGGDPFRVRIASPRIAPKVHGPTKVEIETHVPAGKEIGAIELYYNQRRVATMYDWPFVQTVNIPATDGVGYLRAVATLSDPDAAPVEDLVMINTPGFMDVVDVHLVELPTTVLRGGKPVNDLKQDAFKVLDDGKPVELAKFEYVKDLPLSIGMAVDTSASMEPKMNEARGAAAQFFRNVMRKDDKAFIVAFDLQPHIVQTWSNSLSEINSGLAKLRAEESTSLYDAVVYSLYHFQNVKGQKALVVITDGKDTASKFTYEQTLEYSQRAAVPIYAVGIGIGKLEIDTRGKLGRLCAETGGTVYYISEAHDLTKIYTDIQDELRSQYLLGFYPQAKGTRWREVSVNVADARVKTIRGYYP
jgi:Ca-activated chloride channel family protein